MKKDSAVVVGPKDESEAISLYNHLLGKKTIKKKNSKLNILLSSITIL